jgi:beta-lactamase regulating signal transducer with metallopeptidase domain
MQSLVTAAAMHAAPGSVGVWLAAFAHAAPLAVTALWQGAAIALVLWLCLRFTPRVNIAAAQRFALWAAAFVVVAGLPFLPALARGAVHANAVNTPGNFPIGVAMGAAAHAPMPVSWFAIDDRWALAIAAIWLMASLTRAANLAVHSLRLRRIWKAATPVAPANVDAKLEELLAAALPAQRPVELCTTRKLDRPCVIGFFSPRILIPEWLFPRLTAGELEQVVLHEAEHLRRGDDWTNFAQKVALVVFPLNPALAWIEGRLCREREMACDEGVVRRTQEPRAYAACLARLAERGLERRRTVALSLGAFERRPELARRVLSLLARRQALHPVAARALVGIFGCGLLAASVELARCPQMVAFVPAAHAASQQSMVAQVGPASTQWKVDAGHAQPTAVRGVSGFRAVNTSMILPQNSGAIPASPRRAASRPVKSEETSGRQMADAGAPREVLLKAEMPDANSAHAGQVSLADPDRESANSRFSGQPAFVVLTAWEEIETSPRGAATVADYDSRTATQTQTAGAGNQASDQSETGDQNPARGASTVQIRVTRMIFAIYPTTAKPGAAAPVTPAADASTNRARTDSDYGQPAAPMPLSGWLVFQL